MDMGLFYADLTDPKNVEHRETVFRLAAKDGDKPENFNYSSYSSKAIAMADAMDKQFEKAGIAGETRTEAKKAMRGILNGQFLGDKFTNDGFGAIPVNQAIDMLLDQMEHNGYKFSKEERKGYEDKLFEAVLTPAIEKLKKITTLLVALPGNPTLFAGDDLGATGYEQKTKNIHLKNRDVLHREWVDKNSADYKPFIVQLQKDMKEIMDMRNRPELRPLNDGAPFILDNLDSTVIYEKQEKIENGKTYEEWVPCGSGDNAYRTDVMGVLRQSVDGAMTISLLHTKYNKANDKDMGDGTRTEPKTSIKLDSINLKNDKTDLAENLKLSGLPEGTEFRNADDKNEVYVVKGDKLVRKDGNPIMLDKVTTILYHVPDKKA